MTAIIRRANFEDCPALTTIYNQYLGKATLDTSLRDASYFEGLLEKLDDRECLLVAAIGPLVIGYGLLKKYSWKEGYRFAGETSVFFDEAYVGQGYGKAMKNTLIAKARSLKYRHLVARIMAHNNTSIQYNIKLGYELVGIQKQIGFAYDQWHDVAILQLQLSPAPA